MKRPEIPALPVTPKAREKEAVNAFVNEGNPSTPTPKTKSVSADKVRPQKK